MKDHLDQTSYTAKASATRGRNRAGVRGRVGLTAAAMAAAAVVSAGLATPSALASDDAASAGQQAATSAEPVTPNPFLAQVLEPSAIDYPAWRARMAHAAQDRVSSQSYLDARSAASARMASSAKPLKLEEQESKGPRGRNDSVASAEEITSFGTMHGDSHVLRVSGAISGRPRVGDPAVLAAAAEDDGSIPLATPTGLRRAGAVVAEGVLGDGPHGPVAAGGDGSNDFDVFAVRVPKGHRLVADAAGSGAATGAGVAIYTADGTALASTDKEAVPLAPPRLAVTPARPGRYYVLVTGATAVPLPDDVFDSGSGAGGATTGPYRLSISVEPADRDHYSVRLRRGDVLGAAVRGTADTIRVLGPDGTERVGTSKLDLSGLYPSASPLPGGGNAALGYVAEEPGRYTVSVDGERGAYSLQLEAWRPGAEGDTRRRHTVLLDFEGGPVDTSRWDGPGVRELSPFRTFLPRWGISDTRHAEMVRKVTRSVRAELVEHPAKTGKHRPRGMTADLRVVNTSTHPELKDRRNVTRVYISGTVLESEIATVGVADTVDPGNFGHEDAALVLLDVLSLRGGSNLSLNTSMTPASDRAAFVAQGLGNIVAHEIGHTIGSYHTENRSPAVSLMETGGEQIMPRYYGVGADGVGGTGDDVDVHFRSDQFARVEGFTGREDTLNIAVWAMPWVRQSQADRDRDRDEVRLIKWKPRERTVFLGNVEDRRMLPGAPRSFRTRMHKELRRIWQQELDGAPECKQVGGIQVRSLRTDGFALGNPVSNVGDSGCEEGSSGAVVFWVKRDGGWKRAIESADIVECQDLERFGFPSELGVDQCWNGTEVVDYEHD